MEESDSNGGQIGYSLAVLNLYEEDAKGILEVGGGNEGREAGKEEITGKKEGETDELPRGRENCGEKIERCVNSSPTSLEESREVLQFSFYTVVENGAVQGGVQSETEMW